MLLSNVSLIMKCIIGELLLRKVTALLSFPLPHLFEWLVLYVRLIPVTQFALFLLGFWWRMHLFRFNTVQFPIFPLLLILCEKNSFWSRTPRRETCFLFSILYLSVLSTNSLLPCNSYNSAWGGICQHCCSGNVYLNSQSFSGAPVKNSVLFSILYWGCHKWDLTIYSLLFCYLLLFFVFSALMTSALSISMCSEAMLTEILYVRTSLNVLAMNTGVKVIYFSGLACLLP